jgi:uncharacterized protein (TIGR03663 family)
VEHTLHQSDAPTAATWHLTARCQSALALAALAVVLAGASAFRLIHLDRRPMHCDEAGQAIKFGQLLEEGQTVYDPQEYHGPSLNYLTLPIARLASAATLAEVTETQLRLVPAICGIVLAGLVWLLRNELGLGAALGASVLTAVSAAMVFYSRYYIQEMLLVCFTFGAVVSLWRFAGAAEGSEDSGRRRSWYRRSFWLIVLGTCIGMMHATKETCVIPLTAILIAALLTLRCPLRRASRKGTLLASLLVVLVAVAVSAGFFSSFGSNPRGVVDSITAYAHYVQRAAGQGSAGRHDHAADYYLRILFWWKHGRGPIWTEASIAALALVGVIAAALGRGLTPRQIPWARFLAVFTVVMTVAYSAISYKTPWCAIGVLHGIILLAGIGMAVLVRIAPTYPLKYVVVAVLTAAVGHLVWQSYQASFVACEDPDNPYVYAHTTSDVLRLADRLVEVVGADPNREQAAVQVICPDDDYWPLPWYLRHLEHVGWFSQIPPGAAAPVIVIQAEIEPALARKLYEEAPPGQRYLYLPLMSTLDSRDWQLRPHVPLRVYIRSDLWEHYRRQVIVERNSFRSRQPIKVPD